MINEIIGAIFSGIIGALFFKFLIYESQQEKNKRYRRDKFFQNELELVFIRKIIEDPSSFLSSINRGNPDDNSTFIKMKYIPLIEEIIRLRNK